MASNKRASRPSASSAPSDKEYDNTILTQFHLPTTSAITHNTNNARNINYHQIIDHNNNNHHLSASSPSSNGIGNNVILSTTVQHQLNKRTPGPFPVVNPCHNQAATRSFLFHQQQQQQQQQQTSEPSTTNDSEESVTPPPHYHEIPGIVPAYQGRTSGPPPAYDDVMNPNAPPPTYQSLFGQVREARKTSNGFVDLFRQLFLILIGTIGCTMIIGFLLLIPITMILVGFFYVNECRAEKIPLFLIVGGFVWIVKNILNCYNQFKKDSSTANRPPPRRAPISSNTGHQQQQSTSGTISASSSSASVLIGPNSNSTVTNYDPISINDNSPSVVVNSATLTSDQNGNLSSSSSSTSSSTVTTTSTTTRTRTTLTNRNQQQHQSNPNHIRHPPMIGLTSYKCESILNYFLMVWFLAGCIVVYRIYEPDYENPLSAAYCNRTVYLYAFWLMTSAFIIMAIVLSCLCCLMASSLMSCNHGR